MLSVTEFGRALVTSGDLDPIYMMLNGARLERGLVQRWSLAYWMFYHAGVASRIAESTDFWGTVQRAQDEKWPRGTERRHFKGAQSQRAINALASSYASAEQAVRWVATGIISTEQFPECFDPIPQPFTTVRERAMTWRGFGPWIAFKIADMCDAVLGVPVDFSEAQAYLFDDPVKGAFAMRAARHLDPADLTECLQADGGKRLVEQAEASMADPNLSATAVVDHAVRDLRYELGLLRAPHAPQRRLWLQEYETILCKWKSHLNGRYEPGKDTKEIRHALEGYGELATELRNHLPTV